MSEQRVLVAEKRERAGKGAARAVRREGKVPGVVYGGKETPDLVSFTQRDIRKAWFTGTFLRELCQVEIDGKQVRTIPREVQVHPLTEEVLHVDFLRLGKGARINIEVEVRFTGEEECPGLTKGGVLNVVRYTVELNVSVDAIPPFIELDLSEMEIGGSGHISDVDLPEGAKPTITDRDFTIVTIASPTLAIEDVPTEGDEEGEGIEGEAEEGAEGTEAEGKGDA
jgi:large subunit ribosomal protein L25